MTTRLQNRVRQAHPSLQKHLPTPTPKTTVISNQADRCSKPREKRHSRDAWGYQEVFQSRNVQNLIYSDEILLVNILHG